VNSKQVMRRAKAVRFLQQNPQLWGESDLQIVRALKEAEIVSHRTYYQDVAVRALLRAAQTEPPVRIVRPRCPTCGHVLPREEAA